MTDDSSKPASYREGPHHRNGTRTRRAVSLTFRISPVAPRAKDRRPTLAWPEDAASGKSSLEEAVLRSAAAARACSRWRQAV
jgi:hypothetical protein